MTGDDKDKRIEQLEKENAELRATVAKLLARIEELERRLGMNSKNSSKPPSSDPPGAPKPGISGRHKKRGAKNGHEPHLKALAPPEQVTRRIEIEPEACPDCGGTRFAESGSEAVRDQFFDVPPIEIDVTELVRPVRQCRGCGANVYAPLPEDAPKSRFGPGVLALVGILTGALNVSKRKALSMMNEVFHVPMSLGGLSECEARVAASLEPAHAEAAEYVRKQTVAHADETGWRRGNRMKGWLWTLCCATAAVFMVQARRGQEAARNLIGDFAGVLVSDRWGGYNDFGGPRQICWSHLKRDFFAIGEAGGRLGEIGSALHTLAKRILRLRRRVRERTLRWSTFQGRMPPLMARVEALLAEGSRGKGALAGKCRKIAKHRESLWTFVAREDVAPTNNLAERTIRQGVLWRKGSFGTQSERGARYVERALTVCATCRLQGRSVIEFLREACRRHLLNLPAHSLIA
jgi:transposase